MSFIINPENVLLFEINTDCEQSFPCTHSCILHLSDGRKKNIQVLEGDKIFSLINSIDESKLDGDIDHFKKYKDEGYLRNHFQSNQYSFPNPEEVLATIFREMLESNSVTGDRNSK